MCVLKAKKIISFIGSSGREPFCAVGLVWTALIYFFAVLLFFSTGCQDKDSCLQIACASNVYGAFTTLKDQYESEQNQCVHLSTGSSATLYQQILNHAPYDLFYSADTMYPYELFQKGRTYGKPFTYTIGGLILVATKNPTIVSSTLEDALNFQDIILAIPNPLLAPYGKVAMELVQSSFTYSDSFDIVYGQNVAQTNQLMTSGAVDFIITSASAQQFFREKNYAVWNIPSNLHRPIVQNAVFLKSDRSREATNRFQKFMDTHSEAVFTAIGYNKSFE